MNVLYRGVAASALTVFALHAHASDLIFNGSFEFPFSDGQSCFQNATSGGWSSSGPAQSCYLSNTLPDPWPDAVDGSQFMYLGQNLTANVKLEQSVLLQAGSTYDLAFYLAGLDDHPGGTLVASIGDQSVLTVASPESDSSWVRHTASFTVAATGWQPLSFISPTGGALNIDSVSLVAAPVPEPASWALMAMGSLLLAGVARRSGRQQPRK